MAIIRCANGHFFDDAKYKTCPYCEKKGGMDESVTLGFNRAAAMMEETQPRTFQMKDLQVSDQDDAKTVGIYSQIKGNDFVTGWIVCIKGPEKGRDYPIHYGQNRVGRSAQMDVCIFEDRSISRNSHCSIVYEPRKNKFYIMPESGCITYLNKRLVEASQELQMGDCLRIGESEFEFIPFCREGRRWDQ
ncbi:MAG: FHA domain-containing protein [Clostridia bacterium]|nr:FHA domain-containing protein [Clostridia bacterium]NCC42257.1 FHA domain-containing protein [Clostridia bacterium]